MKFDVIKNNFKEWAYNAGSRAVRTFAQTAIATIGTNVVVISEVNWGYVLSASVLSGIISILTSVVLGIPEVQGTAQPKQDE